MNAQKPSNTDLQPSPGLKSDGFRRTADPVAMPRREFLSTAVRTCAVGAMVPTWSLFGAEKGGGWDPKVFCKLGRRLTVQPVFMHVLPTPKQQSSWRSWGGVQTEAAVDEEGKRIAAELSGVASQAEFGVEVLPVARVSTVEAAQALGRIPHDVRVVYACTGSGDLLRACTNGPQHALIFVRHRSGPVYYWYEALSTRYLRKDSEPEGSASSNPVSLHVDDVVVDRPEELLWRFRALFGVKNLLGTRVIALGGAWGKYAPDAPERAKERFALDIRDVGYEEFEKELRQARADRAVLSAARESAKRYLALPKTKLKTDREAVVNAFVLYRVFRDLMARHGAMAFTVRSCMGTIIPMSETTACLPLELLNDEGLIGFCESDFVIIPAGFLLRYISGKPVFMHNSTFPHEGLVTCAHCTGPRRMDGRRFAPAEIVTHYESDYGAAPKVSMPIGQEVTIIDPEYSTTRWVGFRGVVRANPNYDICRSQQDVEIQGDWQQLRNEVRDSHWMMAYGDYLREMGFAVRKLGLQWKRI